MHGGILLEMRKAMSKQATKYFAEHIKTGIEYARKEFELTYAECLGVLVLAIFDVGLEANEDDGDGDTTEDDAEGSGD